MMGVFNFFDAFTSGMGSNGSVWFFNLLWKDYLSATDRFFFARTGPKQWKFFKETFPAENILDVNFDVCVYDISCMEYLYDLGLCVGIQKRKLISNLYFTNVNIPLDSIIWLKEHNMVCYAHLLQYSINSNHLELLKYLLEKQYFSSFGKGASCVNRYITDITSVEALNLFIEYELFPFSAEDAYAEFWSYFENPYMLAWIVNNQHINGYNICDYIGFKRPNDKDPEHWGDAMRGRTELILCDINASTDPLVVESLVSTIRYEYEYTLNGVCSYVGWHVTRFISTEECTCTDHESHNTYKEP